MTSAPQALPATPLVIVKLFGRAHAAARTAGSEFAATAELPINEHVFPIVETAWQRFCDSTNGLNALSLRQCCMLHAYFRASWLYAAHRAVPTLNTRTLQL